MSADIEEVISTLRRTAEGLWDHADVAAFLKLNPAYVRQHITTRGDFPKPCDLPGKGKEPIRRYRPQDVRDWAETWR